MVIGFINHGSPSSLIVNPILMPFHCNILTYLKTRFPVWQISHFVQPSPFITFMLARKDYVHKIRNFQKETRVCHIHHDPIFGFFIVEGKRKFH